MLLFAGCDGGGNAGGGEVAAPPATLAPELLSLYDNEPGPLDVQEENVEERDDAVEYLGDVAPNALYFQFGEQDEAPTPAQGKEQFDVASEPKAIALYDAGHELDAEARAARADWLAARFGLDD